jgi:hypothetical protein
MTDHRISDVRNCVRTVIQLTYTTLFGFHCAFLFLRTGSLYPPLFSHMFCNFMGLPQIAYELQVFPHKKPSACLLFSEPGGWQLMNPVLRYHPHVYPGCNRVHLHDAELDVGCG